jgi:adenine phosphoribosyltransferase
VSTLDQFDVVVAGIGRTLPLRTVDPGVQIALFDSRGDVELCGAIASAFAVAGLPGCDVVVTIESKAVPLAHELARLLGNGYIVLSKSWRKYMLEPLSASVQSFTARSPERLWLDSHHAALIKGRTVWLVDDVVTTGNTLQTAEHLMAKAGALISQKLVVFKEGELAQTMSDIYALSSLPVFTTKG